MSQRNLIQDAAIDLLAGRGLGALTHRGVDRKLGLPEGTTSNYYRTKQLLLAAVVDRLEQRDVDEFGGLGAPAMPQTPADLVRLLLRYAELALSRESPLLLARLALLANLADEPELAGRVQAAHLRLLLLGQSVFAHFGATNPRLAAEMLADYVDGLLIHSATVPQRRPKDLAELQPGLLRMIEMLCR